MMRFASILILLAVPETLLAQDDQPPSIDGTAPIAGIEDQDITIGISGKHFKQGMKAYLDGNEVGVSSVSPETGTAVVHLPGKPKGVHSLKVTTNAGSGNRDFRFERVLTFAEVLATAEEFKQFTLSTDLVKDGVKNSIVAKVDAFMATFRKYNFGAALNQLSALASELQSLPTQQADPSYVTFGLATVDVLQFSASTFSVAAQETEPKCQIKFKGVPLVTITKTSNSGEWDIKVEGEVEISPKEQGGGPVSVDILSWFGSPAGNITKTKHIASTNIQADGKFATAVESFDKNDITTLDSMMPKGITVRITASCLSGDSTSIARSYLLDFPNFKEQSVPNPTVHITAKPALQKDTTTQKDTNAIVSVSVTATKIQEESTLIKIKVRAFAKLRDPSTGAQTDGLQTLGTLEDSKAIPTPNASFEKEFDFDLVKLGTAAAVGSKNEVVVSTLKFEVQAEVLGNPSAAAALELRIVNLK